MHSPVSSLFKMGGTCKKVRFWVFPLQHAPCTLPRCLADECLHAHLALDAIFHVEIIKPTTGKLQITCTYMINSLTLSCYIRKAPATSSCIFIY